MENSLDYFLKPIKVQLSKGEVAEAIESLQMLDEKFKIGIENDLILLSGQQSMNQNEFDQGILDMQNYRMFRARISNGVLNLVSKIPEKTTQNVAFSQLRGLLVNDSVGGQRLEKIIGGASNLLKINWLEKAIKASKAVCRVVRTDGHVGTGWLIEGGYLMTNHHVLPDKNMANIAEAQFNFEIDSSGNARPLMAYKFDSSDFLTDADLDFTRIKVQDRADQPIAQWGFLEIDGEAVPVKTEAVTIIQHPKGEDKQIALNANEVLGQTKVHLYYSTDTEGGSSGSPVFNKNWKVVALHHAGGQYDFDNSGIPKAANRGILFRFINEVLKKNSSLKPTKSADKKSSKNESINIGKPDTKSDSKATQVSENQLVTPVIAPQNAVPKLVILYDISDGMYADSLGRQLNILKRTGKIALYFQNKDTFGDLLASGKQAMSDATFVVTLVTPAFFDGLAFDLLDAAKVMGKTIIPVLVQSIGLAGTGLEGLKTLPTNGQFIFPNWSNADAAWLDVANGLKSAMRV